MAIELNAHPLRPAEPDFYLFGITMRRAAQPAQSEIKTATAAELTHHADIYSWQSTGRLI